MQHGAAISPTRPSASRRADNPIIAENEAIALSDPDTRASLQKAYVASNALYYRGQPAFDDILTEIAKWSPKL